MPSGSTGAGVRRGNRRPKVGLSAVEGVLQNLARLERQHPAGADGDLLASLGVAAGAGVLVPHDEVAEAGDLDLFPLLQGLLDGVEDRLDDLRRLLLREAADLLVNRLHNVGLRHVPTYSARIPVMSKGCLLTARTVRAMAPFS